MAEDLWFWLRDTKMEHGVAAARDVVVSHMIPEALYQEVFDRLCSKYGLEHYEVKESTELGLDAGGMAMSNEHNFTIELDGLKVRIPARCLKELCDSWAKIEVRAGTEQSYYKFFSWPGRALCLTVDQRNRFIEQLTVLIPEATAYAEAEGKAFNETIDGMNKDRLRIATYKRPEPKTEA